MNEYGETTIGRQPLGRGYELYTQGIHDWMEWIENWIRMGKMGGNHLSLRKIQAKHIEKNAQVFLRILAWFNAKQFSLTNMPL